jgi:uncharacterized protein
MADIRIIIDGIKVAASLDLSSEIGNAIYNSLPMTARLERWGEEIYFPLNLEGMSLCSPVTAVHVGDIAYSERHQAFCIFYGKTPISNESEILPNGPVEVIGALHGDQSSLILKQLFSAYLPRIRRKVLRLVSGGRADTITLEKS